MEKRDIGKSGDQTRWELTKAGDPPFGRSMEPLPKGIIRSEDRPLDSIRYTQGKMEMKIPRMIRENFYLPESGDSGIVFLIIGRSIS